MGSIFFNVSAHSMQGDFCVYVTVETTDLVPKRRSHPADKASTTASGTHRQQRERCTAPQPDSHSFTSPPRHRQAGQLESAGRPGSTSGPHQQQRGQQHTTAPAAAAGSNSRGLHSTPNHGMPSTPAGAASSGIAGTTRATSDWTPPQLQVPPLSQTSLQGLQEDVQRSARSTARTLLSALPRPQRRTDG